MQLRHGQLGGWLLAMTPKLWTHCRPALGAMLLLGDVLFVLRSFGHTAVQRELAAAKKHIHHPGLIESWSGNCSKPFANLDSLNTALNGILLSTLSSIFQRFQSSQQLSEDTEGNLRS